MLENGEIKLRALEPADVDALYTWENNPDNWKVSHTQAPYSRQILMQYIQEVNDIYADKQLRLIIERLPEGERLGTVDLFDCDFKNRRAGLGILVADPAERGRGVASAVLDLIIPYCFEILGLHSIYCNVLADNAASLGLFRKFGFVEVGLKRDWVWHKGRFHDEWLLQKFDSNKSTP